MNIAFLLTPKNEVIYEYLDVTMRQVIEKMSITDIQLFRLLIRVEST